MIVLSNQFTKTDEALPGFNEIVLGCDKHGNLKTMIRLEDFGDSPNFCAFTTKGNDTSIRAVKPPVYWVSIKDLVRLKFAL